jgi:hypothetical protein
MRANGVANFPDPQRGQTTAKFPGAQQLGISGSRYRAAEGSCAHLLPNGGRTTQAALQHMLSELVRLSQCMRAHGVPNWPDPSVGPDGLPGFNLVGIRGLDSSSPETMTKIHECSSALGRALGGIRVRQP